MCLFFPGEVPFYPLQALPRHYLRVSVPFIDQGAAAWAAGIALQQLHRDLVVRTQRPAVPESAAPIPTAPVASVIMTAARKVSAPNLPRLEQNG